MVTDYDQKGNYDMTQTNASKQARVILSGNWLGYKDYNVASCEYYSSNPVTDNLGSVYIKITKTNTSNLVGYFLTQSKPSANSFLSFANTFGFNNDKIRVLDFTPSVNQIIGNNNINTFPNTNIIMYSSDGSNYKLRLNGVNQTKTVLSGVETGNWFNFYSGSGYTLQKGVLKFSSTLYSKHREYEVLGFNVTHSDSESAIIENTM